VAFLTVLQSLRLGPIGSGYLCPPVVSAIYLPSALKAKSARSNYCFAYDRDSQHSTFWLVICHSSFIFAAINARQNCYG
jgi:hypothetical protein